MKHPLEWITLAKSHGWDVLVDVAAYVPTNLFDMKASGADFACLSFYKVKQEKNNGGRGEKNKTDIWLEESR